MPNAVSGAAVSRRRRPRALPTLATIAAVALFVAAGHWQQQRMREKEALRAQADAATRAAPVALSGLPSDADWAALRYRPVTVRGRYDGRRQILIDNKVHEGRVGYDVVTPLVMADDRVVLVDRGWIAQGASRAAPPEAPPPAAAVVVEGRIAVPSTAYVELRRDVERGPVWQNLDPLRYAAATGVPVLPIVIEQTSATDDGLLRDRPAPDFGIEKHRIYMLQWYAFAVLAIALWLLMNLRRGRGAPS